MRLAGKVAIVTGGATGIGRGIAERYAHEGAEVVIAGRNVTAGEEAAGDIRHRGGTATFVRTDITATQDRQNLLRTSLEQHGHIDILVNNAGIANMFSPFLDVSEEMFDKIMGTDLRATFFLSQEVSRAMVRQGKGKIINITTNIVEIVQRDTSPYSVAKAGLKKLTECMAIELASHNILVNAIAPGEIRVQSLTEFFDDPGNQARFSAIPVGRIGIPSDVAGAAVFLASDDSDYVTGTTIFVDGGQMLA